MNSFRLAAVMLLVTTSASGQEVNTPRPWHNTVPYAAVVFAGLLLDHASSIWFSNHPEMGCIEHTSYLRNQDWTYNGKKGLAVNLGIGAGMAGVVYLANRSGRGWVKKAGRVAALGVAGQATVRSVINFSGCGPALTGEYRPRN